MGRKKSDQVEPDEVGRAKPRSRWLGLPLQGHEEVILSASPSKIANLHKYVYTLGFYGIWRKRDTVVITDRRLIVGRGIVNRNEHSISRSQVTGARFSRKGLNSYALVSFEDRGQQRTERVGPMPAGEARRFVAEILSR